MKKILTVILCLALALVFVLGCDSDDTSEAHGGDVELSGTLTVWSWDPMFNIYAMDRAAEIYQQINPDFEINNIEVSWGELHDNILVAGTTGDFDGLPDIFLMDNSMIQRNVLSFPELFYDITDSGIDFSEFVNSQLNFSMVDGRNFGVPFDNGATVMALRSDILGQAGFTVDDFTSITWDTFIEQGMQVLAETGMPMISTADTGSFIAFMLQSAGANLFNADGTPNIAGNTALHEVIETYVRLVESGVLLETAGWEEYTNSFVNDEVVGTLSGNWILGTVQLNETGYGYWAVTNMPRLDIPGGTNYSNFGGSSWLVNPHSENKELAIDFLTNTFAGSVELFDTILPTISAVSSWMPALASSAYTEPHPFFGGQQIFADILNFSANIPAVNIGLYHGVATDSIGIAMSHILEGADIVAELQAAQESTEFAMS